MPHGATLDARLKIYRKVLIEEFLRELKFLIDVLANRATARGDFTDKIVEGMKSSVDIVVGFVPDIFPGIGIVKVFSNKLISTGFDKLNDQRREKQLEGISDIQFEVDFEALRISLEILAIQACQRYEFVIATKLSEVPAEAVIPFAKAGVERMLEYVARHRLALHPEHLLMGLVYGRSGAYVSGYFNTPLVGKQKKMVYTAEGIYSRSGFMTPQGHYWVARKASSHNLTPLAQSLHDLMPETIKGFVGKKKNENNAQQNPLKVKFDKCNPTDPKYGYVMVHQSSVDHYFGKTKERQELQKLSMGLQQAIKNHSVRYQLVTRADIESYLNGDKKLSFIQFLKTKYPHIKTPIYEPENDKDLDLSNLNFRDANFNDCILNGIKIGGDISNCQFQNSRLFGADLSKVTQAKGANFHSVHGEFIKATDANLSYANFTGAQLQFSDFSGTNLSNIQTLGAQWYGATLVGLKTESKTTEEAINKEQKRQLDILKAQRQKLNAFEKQLQQNNEDMAELKLLAKRIEAQLTKADIEKAQSKQEHLKKLQALMAELMQEKQTREAFTRYCQNELTILHEKTGTADERLQSHEEQIRLLQEQLQRTPVHEAPVSSLITQLQTVTKQLESVDDKQQLTNQGLIQLETNVNQFIQSQQSRVETVFQGLANIHEEIEQFKLEVRRDMKHMDNRISALEQRLQQQLQVIPQNERRDIYSQQIAMIMSQLTALQLKQSSAKLPIDPHHVISSTYLRFEHKLAEGSFGKVYLGHWSEQVVAIKMLEGNLSPAEEREFIREVNIMSRLRHPHVVLFYGACLESRRACIVMEYMEQGSLTQFLAKTTLNSGQKKLLALDIIRGLQYLHSQQVLHRDFKSGNILVNTQGRAKITDFGLSKVNYASVQSIHKQVDAIQWQSPESLQSEMYTEKSDIYSFGIILWEIFTQRKPYAPLQGPSLRTAILNGQQDDIPKDVPVEIGRLITACWQRDPEQRPTLIHILHKLETFQPRAPSPSPEEYYKQGCAAEDAQRLEDARILYQKSAERNFPKAKTNLATFYLRGIGGCPQDKSQAFRLYEEAAKQHHNRAMSNVARMLEKGDGVPRDWEKALYWYQQASIYEENPNAKEVARKKIELLTAHLKVSYDTSNSPTVMRP